MPKARLEHANVTVSDPQRTAEMLINIFDWHVRWQGESIDGGHTIHVGEDNSYLALYKSPKQHSPAPNSYTTTAGLNHLAVVVEDLHATKQNVLKAGLTPGEHHDYEPGERFYFRDHDNIEYEVVSYTPAQ